MRVPRPCRTLRTTHRTLRTLRTVHLALHLGAPRTLHPAHDIYVGPILDVGPIIDERPHHRRAGSPGVPVAL